MTLADLRALCDAPGWSTGRVARAIGRAPDTVRGWLRGDPLGAAAADWLARVETIAQDARGRATVRVALPPPGRPGRPPRQ